MSDDEYDLPGGFLPATGGLPSPAPSGSSSTRPSGSLPHPRGRSLQPGSNKEAMTTRYVEERLLHINRRYIKKFSSAEPGDSLAGYTNFGEVCRDLDGVVNVLWLSGTPSLQIPFLLRLASDFTQFVRSFPPSPKATFDLLGKLDHCFSSILMGRDLETKEWLPGFENSMRAGMTTTDMVRCRSLVEQTRVLMVEVMSSGDFDDEEDEKTNDTEDEDDVGHQTDDTEMGFSDTNTLRPATWDADEDRLHLDAARIYENTIVQLGERLGDPMAERRVTDD
ncbi:subunit 11 of the general transcription factor TFIIH domain-containing protein [Sarocladium implicatum]|nr:subunit 11 of the general transcription factor TFIIH domain-containing protein [Sarocladium implicatum]